MVRKLSLLVVLFALLAAPWVVSAQADTQALRDELITVYQNTNAIESYRLEAEDELEQQIVFSQPSSQVFMMDVEVSDAFIITLAIETTTTAEVNAADLSATISTAVEQEQGLGNFYEMDDETLSIPEGPKDEAEIEAQFILLDNTLYINLDETKSDYRAGVPEGWQVVGNETLVLTDTLISIDDLMTALNNARFDATRILDLLNTDDAIQTIETLDDDEIDGQAMQRYFVTLDAAAAVQTLGLDMTALTADVPSAAIDTLISNATYTIEVWVGADDQLVHQQIIAFSMNETFAPGTLDGAPEDAAVTYTYTQTNTLQLTDFGADITIEAPDMEVTE